jgi:hypothetical protein
LEHFGGFTLAGFLTVVDLPQIQDLPLDHPIVLGTSVFHNATIVMFFAILEAGLDTQKHAISFGNKYRQIKGLGRHYKPFYLFAIGLAPFRTATYKITDLKISKNRK